MLVYVIGANYTDRDIKELQTLERQVRKGGHDVYSSKSYATIKRANTDERSTVCGSLIKCNEIQLDRADIVLAVARLDGISGIELGLAISKGKKVVCVRPEGTKTVQCNYLEKMRITTVEIMKIHAFLNHVEKGLNR